MPASPASTVAGILARFPSAHVLVVGDLIVDRFVWGKVERISPEAPVPVVRVTEENLRLGGAANVAHNLRSLGARVSLAGVVGRDALGEWFRDELAESGVHRQAVVLDPRRRTTEKTRVVAQHQQVVRFDREDPGVLPPPVAERLARAVARRLAHADAVILSDYGKGVLSESLVRELIRAARARGVPVLVDPIVEATPRYRGATLVTPNLKEAAGMAAMTIDDGASLARAGRKLLETLALDGALITRGEDGMTLFGRGRPPVHIPTTARDVFDVTGAGDTVIATLAVCEALGVERSLGARLSNAAAGIVVGKVGTATVTAEELRSACEA